MLNISHLFNLIILPRKVDMSYTEQIQTFSEAGNFFPRLLPISIALNLMLLGLGPGDSRNSFDAVTYCRIANVGAVFIPPNFSWAEAIFLANSSGESCAL